MIREPTFFKITGECSVNSDRVDRGHLHQFCDLVGGNASIVMADDPISPPPFRDGKQELLKLVNGEPATGSILTRPRICRIPKYNFLMISTFQFGMMEGEQYPAEWWEVSLPSCFVLDRR